MASVDYVIICSLLFHCTSFSITWEETAKLQSIYKAAIFANKGTVLHSYYCIYKNYQQRKWTEIFEFLKRTAYVNLGPQMKHSKMISC